jgi:hypothetical protein
MSEENITQGTRYFNALKDVAEAARKVEEARVHYEDTLDKLTSEKREAEKGLREALARAAEMTGESLPTSRRDKDEQRMKEMLRRRDEKDNKK